MATVQTTNPNQNVADNPQAGTQQRADLFVNEQLAKAATYVKVVDLFGSLMQLMWVVLGGLLLLSVVDAWIFELPTSIRTIAFLGILGVAIYWVAKYIVPLIIYRINPAYAARSIEKRRPELKNSLINYLSMRGDSKFANSSVFQLIGLRAATDLSEVHTDDAADSRKLVKVGIVLAVVLLACILYKVFSPIDPFQTVARVVQPLSNLSRPSRINITDVTPGNQSIYFGQSVEVMAKVDGTLAEDQEVILVYQTRDGQQSTHTIAMKPNGSGGEYKATLKTDSVGIQQSLTYYVVAGDGESAKYAIDVQSVPTVSVEKIQYQYPEYTGDPAVVKTGDERIEGIEGTEVNLTARANYDLSSAYIEFLRPKENEDKNAERQFETVRTEELQVSGTQINGQFKLRLSSDRSSVAYTHYRFKFTPDGDKKMHRSVEYPVNVIADLPPVVKITEPLSPESAVPLNRSLVIEVEAFDPDYEIHDIRLVFSAPVAVRDQNNVLAPVELAGMARVSGRFEFKPQLLRLNVGDEVTFFARARDNRQSVASVAIDSNVVRTEQFKIKITKAEVDRGANDAGSRSSDPQNDDSQDDDQKNKDDQDNQRSDNKDQNQKDGKQGDGKQGEGKQGDGKQSDGKQGENNTEDSGSDGAKESMKNDPGKGNPNQQQRSESNNDQDKKDPRDQQGNKTQGQEKNADNKDPKDQNSKQQDQDKKQQDTEKQSDKDQDDQQKQEKQDDSSTEGSKDQQDQKQNSDQQKDSDQQQGSGGSQSQEQSSDGGKSETSQDGSQGSEKSQDQAGSGNDSQDSQGSSGNNDDRNSAGTQNDQSGTQGSDSSNTDPQNQSGSNANEQLNSDGAKSENQDGIADELDKQQPDSQPLDRDAHPGERMERLKELYEKSKEEREKSGGSNEKSTSESQSDPSRAGDPENKNDSTNRNDSADADNKDQKNGLGGTDNEDAQSGNDQTSNNENDNADSETESGNSDQSDQQDSSSGNRTEQESNDAQQGSNSKDAQGGNTEKSNDAAKNEDANDSTGKGLNEQDSKDQDSSDGNKNNDGDSGQEGNKDSDSQQENSRNNDSSQQDSSQNDSTQNDSSQNDSTQNDSSQQDSGKQGDQNARNNTDGNQDSDKNQTGPNKQNNPDGDRSQTDQSDQSTKNNQKDGDPAKSNQKDGDPTKSNNQDSNQSQSGDNASQQNKTERDTNRRNADQKVGRGKGLREKMVESKNGSGGYDPAEERANLEYAKKATDLALKYLEEQQDNPDQKLLEEMNWTPEEMREFLKRWKSMKDKAATGNASEQREFNDALKSLGLRPPKNQLGGADIKDDDQRGMMEDGAISNPPADIAKKFRAFQRGRSRAENQRD